MIEVVEDTLGGEPFEVVLNTPAHQQPLDHGWLPRAREVNRLLKASNGATHLVRHVANDPSQEQRSSETWYAGMKGLAIGAGIERMAVDHEIMRQAIVLLPCDTRVYWADLRDGVLQADGMPFPNALNELITEWRSETRTFVVLNTDGEQVLDLPNATEVDPAFEDTDVTMRSASTLMLRTGLPRWRDWIALISLCLVTSVAYAGVSFWDQDTRPTLTTNLFVAEVPPPRYRAAAELAAFTHVIATHDATLWQTRQVQSLRMNPVDGMTTLRGQDPDSWQLESVLRLPHHDLVQVQPFQLNQFATQLIDLLQTQGFDVIPGEPYELGGGVWTQVLTLTVGQQPVQQLLDLVHTVRHLPVQLDIAECTVHQGLVQSCRLVLSIRDHHAVASEELGT